jgi:PAS domain S-box-containing protein
MLLMVAILLVAVWNWILKKKVARMTADLGRSERRYRVLFESSPDMIFLLTPEGCIRHANRRSRSAFSDDGTTCLDINNLVTVDEKKRMRQFLFDVLKTTTPKDEFYVVLKDGHFLDLEIIATLVQDFEDGPLACCFARDVTERNRMEEDLPHSERPPRRQEGGRSGPGEQPPPGQRAGPCGRVPERKPPARRAARKPRGHRPQRATGRTYNQNAPLPGGALELLPNPGGHVGNNP